MHERPTFGSLFAGIGGIDLGLERAGWECRFQVEWDPFCQRVLAKHWPDVPRFGDIHDVHGPLAHAEGGGRDEPSAPSSGEHQGQRARAVGGRGSACPNCLPTVDLLAGGFPCQPFSVAGKQRRLDDDRWLWPEFARAIRELRPRFVLIENVPGLLGNGRGWEFDYLMPPSDGGWPMGDIADDAGGGMGAVLGDLAELGYDAEWESIPAAAVGAPHLRYRVWIIAYANRDGEPRRPVDGGSGQGLVVHEAHAHSNADGDGRDDGSRSRETGGDRGAALGGPQGLGASLADTDGSGPQGRPIQPERPDERPAGAGGVADADSLRRNGRAGELGPRGWGQPSDGDWWSVEPDVGRVAHGVPARVDRLRSLGNAVVPQVVQVIGERLIHYVND